MRAVEAPEDAARDPLLLTGERTLPGIPEENYWFSDARSM